MGFRDLLKPVRRRLNNAIAILDSVRRGYARWLARKGRHNGPILINALATVYGFHMHVGLP